VQHGGFSIHGVRAFLTSNIVFNAGNKSFRIENAEGFYQYIYGLNFQSRFSHSVSPPLCAQSQSD
jgi:hypothetical protein